MAMAFGGGVGTLARAHSWQNLLDTTTPRLEIALEFI